MMRTYISTLLVLLLAFVQAAPAGNETARAASPDADAMLERLFDQGLEHYNANRFGEAIHVFDAMLAIDKYNTKAVTYRRRAAKRMGVYESQKREASREQALAEINATWNPQPKFYGSIQESLEISLSEAEQQAIERMKDRLKAINIPSLDFNNANLEDVAFFLAEASSRLGHRGEDVDFALVGLESAPDQIPVSLSIADMSLYDALEFISDMTSLKFEIGANVVSIMPANFVPPSQMVTKSYNITPEVGANLETSIDSGGEMGDLFGDATSSTSSSGPVDVTKAFAMVDFPRGASALYRSRFQKLFVKNTPKNLKAVEKVLMDLNEQAIKRRTQQVEIEAKFVEFSEGALEELGFKWAAYGSGSAASMQMDPRNVVGTVSAADTSLGQSLYIDPITGQRIVTGPDDRPGQYLFWSSQRNNLSAFEPNQLGLLSLLGGNPGTMAFGNGDIDLRIAAMEQEGTADVLSAPKVTTKSGSEAIIRVAVTHRYPQDYDVETGQRTAPVVKPQDWEDFDLGVSLKVTPEVDADSGTIDLELHPEIKKFIDYDPYIVGYNAYDIGGNNSIVAGGDASDLIVQMASFERRSVETQVSVADGRTVVMGGLIDERTETFRDQIPILGDVPLLGRLFRTEGSRTAKKNLTIFVKASLVDDHGRTRSDRELARQVALD